MGRKFTEKDTEAFLSSIQMFALKNHEKLVQILELRTAAENCTVRLDKESVQSSGDGDKLTKLVGRIVDIEREIYRTEKIIEHRRAEFEEITKKMSDPRQREYLTVRYYDGNGFYDTAMIMDLSGSTMKRIHRKAIKDFTKKFNEKHYI